MPFNQNGHLPLNTDPKLGWAQANLQDTPIELNTADRHALLQVPGIGPKSADLIMAIRRETQLRDLKQLQRAGIATKRAAPFILLAGTRPSRQLSLAI